VRLDAKTAEGPQLPLGAETVRGLYDWLRDRLNGDQVSLVFEKGDKDQGIFSRWMEGHNYPRPDFEGKNVAQLQAADLIAWEHHKFVVKAEEQGGTDITGIRKSLGELSKMHTDWRIYTKQELLLLCEKSSIPLRASAEV
jgi:hypothetical protein